MSMGDNNFISQYLEYSAHFTPEVPAIYSRWCCIVGIGALLGRQYYLPFGHEKINPNLYTMLIGSPGTRKGTGIKLIAKFLRLAGYTNFASERTSKEKFLLTLESFGNQAIAITDILDQNLFGSDSSSTLPDSEIFIAIDEFNDFIGSGNIEFMSMLGNMWNYEGVYKNEVKTGHSAAINNPTISILGGNTPTGFKNAFPVDMIGQGFLSRLLLVYGEPNGVRVTIPDSPSPEDLASIYMPLQEIRKRMQGPAELTKSGFALLDRIYQANITVDDYRFNSYSNRRLNQLIKLCIIVSAAKFTSKITDDIVIEANTILTHTEHFMPKALGEFGKAKNSDVTHTVLEIIYNANRLITMKEIFQQCSKDFEDLASLGKVLINLQEADRIQSVPGGRGFLPKRKMIEQDLEGFVEYSRLTNEEREMKK